MRSISAARTRLMTRPIVFSSLSAGSPTLTVRPCFSLSSTSLAMSRNSEAWKVFSANQRSTMVGSERLCSTYASAAASVPSGRSQLLEGGHAQLLLGLDHDHGRLGLGGDGVRHGPEQEAPVGRRVRRLGRCAHHHQVVAGRLADDRRAAPMSPRAGCRARACVPPCSRTNRSSASCSRWRARCADPLRDHVQHRPPARRSACPGRGPRRIASSACGPPRTGTRIERTCSTPRCLTTAMSHGDSRTTASMVGEKTGRRAARRPRSASASRARRAGDGGPPQPKMTRSVPSSPTASITPSAARRPMRTMVRISTPSSSPKSRTRCSSRREVRAWVAPSDRRDALRDLDDAERGDLGRPPVADAGADAHQVARRARIGERQQDAVRRAPRAAIRPSPGRPRASPSSARRGTA